jgi:hypothetical protein
LIDCPEGESVPGCKAGGAVILIVLLPRLEVKYNEPVLEVHVTLIPIE